MFFLQFSCLQVIFVVWFVQVRLQMCFYIFWQRIFNRFYFLLLFFVFIIRSLMVGKSKFVCKFLKIFQYYFFLDYLNIMGIIIYLLNMKVEKKNRILKWLIYVVIKIGIKVIFMLECFIFLDLRFKGMQVFSYQYIKFFFFELLYRGLDMERFYRVKN